MNVSVDLTPIPTRENVMRVFVENNEAVKTYYCSKKSGMKLYSESVSEAMNGDEENQGLVNLMIDLSPSTHCKKIALVYCVEKDEVLTFFCNTKTGKSMTSLEIAKELGVDEASVCKYAIGTASGSRPFVVHTHDAAFARMNWQILTMFASSVRNETRKKAEEVLHQ